MRNVSHLANKCVHLSHPLIIQFHLHLFTHFCDLSSPGCSHSIQWSSGSCPLYRALRWLSLSGCFPLKRRGCHRSASPCLAGACSSGAPAGCKAGPHSPKHPRCLTSRVRARKDEGLIGVKPDHHAIGRETLGAESTISSRRTTFSAHIPSVMLPDAEQGYQTPVAWQPQNTRGRVTTIS